MTFSVFLDVSSSVCGAASGIQWSVSYPHSMSGNQITVVGSSTVYVTATYICGGHSGGSATANFYPGAIPSVGVKVGNTSVICAGGSVELDIINAFNVGVSPTYDYYVDNTWKYSGSDTKYYVSGLSAGSHSAYVTVHASGNTNCTNVASSNPIGFNITAQTKPELTLYPPGDFCQSTNPTFQANYHVDISNTYGGQPIYSWYVNGTSYQNNFPNFSINLNQAATVRCHVNITGASATCFVQPDDKSATTNITPPVTPAITNISSPKDASYYCTGESIQFQAVGQNMYGTLTYKWYVDSYYVGQTTSGYSPSIPTASVPSAGVMGPQSSVRVEASGFSGACFTFDPFKNPYTASTTRYSTPINVTPTLAPPPPETLCAGATTQIPLSTDVSTATFQWTQSVTSGDVSGSSNSQGAVSATSIVQALTTNAGGTVRYTITPSGNGCVGSSKVADITVNPIPATPVISSSGVFSRCGAGPITLSAQPGAYGTEVHWYDGSGTGANYLGNNASISPNVTASTMYYASSYNSNTACEGPRAVAQALVKDKYSALVNSVITQQVLVEGVDVNTDITAQPIDNVLQNIQYFDGLGRHYQDVMQQNTVSGNDLVQSSVYDKYGREYKKYLPVTVGSDGCPKDMDSQGNYMNTTAQNFYSNTSKVASDTRPFSQSTFEPSPLSRALQEAGPGATWNDASKYVSHQYLVNQTNEVYLFNFDSNTGLVSLGSGTAAYFDAGQLQSKVTTDEQGNEVREYTDKLGRMLCKKVQYQTDGNGIKQYASTYYVYDDFGNLAAVLPPEAVKKIISQIN
jgi:hypothetical protein